MTSTERTDGTELGSTGGAPGFDRPEGAVTGEEHRTAAEALAAGPSVRT